MRNLDDVWHSIKSYQEQADLDGHGATWRTALEERTVAACFIASEDAGEQMVAADPTWQLLSNTGRKRRPNDDYERIYRAGEAMCSAIWAIEATDKYECAKWANCTANLIAQALGETEDET